MNFLFEMTSGLDCFPEALEDVALWTAWFKYMMPFLVSRSHERYVDFLLEGLITTFIRVYETHIDDEYSGFRLDALACVGQALMKPEFWPRGEICAPIRHDWLTCDGQPKASPSCNGAISAAISFCLLYLPTEQILLWTKSLFAIESVHFRAHLLVWLCASYDCVLDEANFFSVLDQARFDIRWESSFLLAKERVDIQQEKLDEFFSAVRKFFTYGMLVLWLKQFSVVPELAALVRDKSIAEYAADVLLAAS